jgi:hypothetical protein
MRVLRKRQEPVGIQALVVMTATERLHEPLPVGVLDADAQELSL